MTIESERMNAIRFCAGSESHKHCICFFEQYGCDFCDVSYLTDEEIEELREQNFWYNLVDHCAPHADDDEDDYDENDD